MAGILRSAERTEEWDMRRRRDRDGVETQRSCIEGTVGASAVLGHGVAKQFIERA